VTAAVAKVVSVFLADPGADRYGLDLMRATGHPSGTLYPILLRLQRAGWVVAQWEDVDPASAGRPARRYYRLTPDGVVAARAAVAELYEQLTPGFDPKGRPVTPRTAARPGPGSAGLGFGPAGLVIAPAGLAFAPADSGVAPTDSGFSSTGFSPAGFGVAPAGFGFSSAGLA